MTSSLDPFDPRPKRRKGPRKCDHSGCDFTTKSLSELGVHVTLEHASAPRRLVSCWRCATEHDRNEACPSCGFVIPLNDDGFVEPGL